MFNRLLNLHSGMTPEENFFTEVFVALLKRNKGLLDKFLEQIIGLRSIFKSDIESQVSFEKIEDHEHGSRPDVLIRLYRENGKPVIVFCELKLGSREHGNQLERYAEQAENKFGNSRVNYLVYITQYYDPKEERQVIAKTGKRIRFISITWGDFYKLIKEYQDASLTKDSLIEEVKTFMEEKRMNNITQLLPVDYSAMSSVQRLLRFMKSSLEGEVEERYRKVIGVKPKNIRLDFMVLDEGWIVLWESINKTNDLYYYLGYELGTTPSEYPRLVSYFEIDPKCHKWGDICQQFKRISSEKTRWKIEGADNPSDWTGLYMEVPFTGILSKENHLEAVKKQFLSLLDEVAILRKSYPLSSWFSK